MPLDGKVNNVLSTIEKSQKIMFFPAQNITTTSRDYNLRPVIVAGGHPGEDFTEGTGSRPASVPKTFYNTVPQTFSMTGSRPRTGTIPRPGRPKELAGQGSV